MVSSMLSPLAPTAALIAAAMPVGTDTVCEPLEAVSADASA